MFLDLGDVHSLATVRVNGKNLGTLWTVPWRVNITDVAKPGANTLEIEVVNVWNNRLVGDAVLPVEQRHSTILLPTVTKDSSLMPAGLLGPIKLLSESF